MQADISLLMTCILLICVYNLHSHQIFCAKAFRLTTICIKGKQNKIIFYFSPDIEFKM